MLPQSSVIDDAIRALAAVIQAALPDVQVLDGPSVERPEKDVVVVGFGEPAVLFERSQPDFGGRCTETGDIVCVISCWDGDPSVAAKRRRVFTYLTAIEAALRDNPRLVVDGEYPDGAVDDSIIGDNGQLTQTQQKGALAALGFSVRYEAHI